MHDFRRLYDTARLTSHQLASLSSITPVPRESTSGPQELFKFGLSSLIRAGVHERGRSFNKTMYNMEVLVFCLWWFRVVGALQANNFISLSTGSLQGFMDFPNDGEALRQILDECDIVACKTCRMH